MYQVTINFIGGNMKGITLTQTTSVQFTVGRVIKGIGGSTYKVLGCVRV